MSLPNTVKISAADPVYTELPTAGIFPAHVAGQDTPGVAFSALQPRSFYGTITGLTGGTATDLDSLPTVGRVNVLVILNRTELEFWVLTAGTAATNAANGIVRPIDYDGTTNQKNWIRKL